MKLARKRRIPVIEDMAQSYLCRIGNRLCGTYGDMSCFSLNETKHIGAGDGGLVITNDPRLADRADLFADKCYDRTGTGRLPFFAPYNYRLNNLVAAVCLEQLKLVKWVTARRHRYGDRISRALADLPGFVPLRVVPGGYVTYYYHIFHIDGAKAGADRAMYVKALQAEGVPVSEERTSVLGWPLFRDRTVNRHACAWACPLYKGKVDYDIAHFPGVAEAQRTGCHMQISEHWSDADVADLIRAFRKVSRHYAAGR
jgi:dTDP-4-amino-4,6-dideoxygalactose transaminase